MRGDFLLILLVSAALCGCRSNKPRAVQGKAPTTRAEVVQPRPTTRPVEAIRGRVTSVRPDLRFVIVDFVGGKLPVLDQQLSVYRLDQKVAEVRISGPYRGTTVAADVTAGDAMPGDLVRDR